MWDARRYGLGARLLALVFFAACSSAKKPLPPPDLSSVGETFAPAKATLGEALGVSKILSFDADTRAAQLDRLDGLGVHLVRRDFLWADLEPSDGVFDFAAEDAAVDDSRARGLTTIGLLAYDAPWAAADGDIATPPDPQKFAAFVAATVKHFAGRVDLWELWNEPNVSTFWKPRGDGFEYAKLLAAAAPAVRRANPEATVILGGLLYHDEAIVVGADQFLEDAFAFNPDLGDLFDVLALHPYVRYPPQAPPEQDDAREQPVGAMVARMRALVDYYGAPKPVWVTEYGWPIYGTVDEAAQARFTVRGALEAMAAGAERVCIYTLDDGPNPTAFPPEDAFGLYRNDGTPKAAVAALHELATIDPSLAVTDYAAGGGVRHYTLRSPSAAVDVYFAVDGMTHVTPAGDVGADPVYVTR